ncbi:MAG: carbon storage regulator [Planctomycetaceae bacterium]|nr:MAG: carbon storage regulator [Planctomycetaceae bacterium]
MLVLSRRIGEEIQIGSCVNLRVLGISQGRVKLGIAGPRTVDVTRAELVDGTAVKAQQSVGSSQQADEGGALNSPIG